MSALNENEWQRCPVCGGCGWVPQNFYTGMTVATSATNDTCRTCSGSGVLERPKTPRDDRDLDKRRELASLGWARRASENKESHAASQNRESEMP